MTRTTSRGTIPFTFEGSASCSHSGVNRLGVPGPPDQAIATAPETDEDSALRTADLLWARAEVLTSDGWDSSDAAPGSWLPGSLEAVICDSGDLVAVDITDGVLPDDLAEQGRGLPMARAAVDELTYERVGERNRWRISRDRTG